MDIRSRAESLRPVRYFLNYKQRDQEPDFRLQAPNGDAGDDASLSPIAIIGMGCRFPDADDPAQLLDVVLTGRRAFRRLPPVRVDLTDYYSSDRATPDTTYSARAAVLEGWQFDLAAFGVPPALYQAADPAQWLALETSARALAAAGFALGQGLASSRTGVIIGNTLTGDWSRTAALRLRWPYVRQVLEDALAAGDIPKERAIPVLEHAAQRYLAPFPAVTDETLAGSTPAVIASRICGFFGFRGGGYTVDGSQASALLAVASACSALADGDLDVALAGGVDLSIDPLELVGLAKTGALARGDVRIYDENPTGFLPGEGCGVLVLMRSADARRARLPVYAEITGWGTSSAAQAGTSAPDAASQLLALRRAYRRAGIAPADVQLIEGHGGGTPAADSTELHALAELRADARSAAALGSIKANIGNAKAAAGAAGLIKTVLAMSTGYIPPTTGVTKPHPLLRSGDAGLRLPSEPEPWPDGPRTAGVSAMGSGINVHIVLRSEPVRGRHERKRGSRSRQQESGPAAAPVLTAGGATRATAYLLHAPDRNALAAILSRIAHVAPWLSDAELGDLAIQLANDAAAQGPVRLAIVASNQDQLARLASQGTAMLSGLVEGLLAARPGIFAAEDADGRVTLLLSDAAASTAGGVPADQADALSRQLTALRWLDELGVRANAAVGYGHGEIAGLVWAGCLSEADALALAASRMQILNAEAPPDPAGTADDAGAAASDRASRLRDAVGALTIAAPGHRLISAAIGREVVTAEDVADLLCAQLDCSPGLAEALGAGAIGASLLLETGPGAALSKAASVQCEVPAVSLGSGMGVEEARVAAALFTTGALRDPALLFAGRPSRPLDIWREQTFIANPCQLPPSVAPPRTPDELPVTARTMPLAEAAAAARRAAAAERAAAARPASADLGPAEPAPAEPGRAEQAPSQQAPSQQPATAPAAQITSVISPAVRAITARGTTPIERAIAARGGAAAGAAPPRVTAPGPRPAAPPAGPQAATVAGVRSWARCFTEELRPIDPAAAGPPGDDRPWRVRAATNGAFGALVRELFGDDCAADRALVVVDEPGNPDSCAVALAAARDGISSGKLVLITHGPGFTGFCASLHAEHPEMGITVLRVPDSAEGLRAAQRFAAAEPGTFRELLIDDADHPNEVVMRPTETPGSTEFPLGPGDVVLVSRGSGGAGLALAQVLACCGARIAVIGREGPGETDEVEAGLEQLRAAEVRMAIETADLANPTALRRALQRIERRLGPVTAVAHAAGVGGPRAVADLAEDDLRAQVSAEAMSLDRLVGAITAKRLRLIITFGSVAQPYGLAGEGLLALASASLADQAQRIAGNIPRCRALHVDWPAWSGPGLGQRDSLAGALASSGATAIPVTEGARLLLKTLGTPGMPSRVAVHGRVGVPAPPAIAAGAAPTPEAAKLWRGRFLENVRVYYPGVELVCDARLTLRTDPYLSDHRIDGIPVLPAAMALEAMAEVVAALAGRPMRRLTGVSMNAPVVVPAGSGDAHALIRIAALAAGSTVTAVLRCAESGFATDHFRATFHSADTARTTLRSLAARMPELDEMPADDSGIIDGTELYEEICFQSGQFRRAALLPEVTSRSCRALVSGGDPEPWFGYLDGVADTSLVLGSAGLNDAAWHVLQACVPHRRLLPSGCDAVTFSGNVADGAVEIRAVEIGAAGIRAPAVPEQRLAGQAGAWRPAVAVPAQGGSPDAALRPSRPPEYVWDVEAVNGSGQPLVTWRGLRLADAGPLRRDEPWPPSLLAVYLERCAVAMGLNPDLHVAVHRGEPDDGDKPEGTQPQDARPQPESAKAQDAKAQSAKAQSARAKGVHRAAQPAAVVPQPAPSPDDQPAAGAQGSPGTYTVRGSGPLERFALTVRAPEGAACAWEPALPGLAGGPEPGPGLADIEDQLRSGWGEPTALDGARLRAIAACLAAAGTPAASPVVADVADGDGWLLLRVAGASMACTVVEITGVPCAVAIAIMTRDQVPAGEPGRHARRPGAAEAGTGSVNAAVRGGAATGPGRRTGRGRTAIES
ncbi:MAG TPA: SDR family NAD(P)-dependent oxidoreductase [Streptosporangiaceae bacterium]|nr:SDR family NAD(P)-dependent oxidoreductase [Streptosporangiaceae bacterium]